MASNFKLQAGLASLGLVPFVALSLCTALGLSELPILGEIESLYLNYCFAIVVFMSGVHWGQALALDKKALPTPAALLVSSNISTIIAWVSFSYLSTQASISVMSALFLLLLYIDSRLKKLAVITKQYLKVRTVITLLVLASNMFFNLFTFSR